MSELSTTVPLGNLAPMAQRKRKHLHPYVAKLREFVGKEVIIVDGSQGLRKGTCLAISEQHLNVILEHEGRVTAVRDVGYVSFFKESQ